MSSPEPKGAERPSGSAAKSHKPEMNRRRRRMQPSPFKVPDTDSIFRLSLNEKGNQKEELRKFLALPIDEKTTHAARTMAKLKNALVGGEEEEEEEEEAEGKEDSKRITGKTALPKGTSGRREQKMTMLKRESVTKDSKHDLIAMERQKAVLELSLMTKRSEIQKMDRAIAKEERQLKQLERLIERDNLNFEEFLRENEKKSVEARTHFEEEAKIKQKKNAEIKRLSAEIGTIESELAKFEEVLSEYKSYQELLFKLSPPEWQEEQKVKASKAEVRPDKQDDQQGEPEETLDSERKASSAGGELQSNTESGVAPANSSTLNTNCEPVNDSLEYEDDPALYFTEPQQLTDLMTELTEQNLFLIQNTARVEETLEDLRHSMKTTRKKIESDGEKITVQINDIKERIDKEKARGVKLEQTVQLHVSLNTEDQDVMLDALGEKVAEVHRSCVDDRIANLSTLERLSNIESRTASLLQGLESIPEDKLATMKRIKESEKRSRQREEKLQEQKEKQRERMRRYLERSLSDSKKVSGRKLMPRSMPVTRRARVKTLDNVPAEDEMQDYLFDSEDTE